MLNYCLQTFDIVYMLSLYVLRGCSLFKQVHQSCDFVFTPCIGFKTHALIKLWGCFHCNGIYYISLSGMTLTNSIMYIKQIQKIKMQRSVSYKDISCLK